MLKKILRAGLKKLNYELIAIPATHPRIRARLDACHGAPDSLPPPLAPVWPLPRNGTAWSDQEIRDRFSRFSFWHYPFTFQGGLSFSARHSYTTELADAPDRPLQRFAHFMPYLLAASGGSLKGKRILDIGCNSGFWSIQCALLGAEVVGFDARSELIDQADLVKEIVGADNANFRTLDFWDMNPETLGGKFDIVLNLGILYHLPNPLTALSATVAMSRRHVLLDTGILRSGIPLVRYKWEEPDDIRMAAEAGIIANPSPAAIDLFLLHCGARSWFRVPLRPGLNMSPDYLNGFRASWLIETA